MEWWIIVVLCVVCIAGIVFLQFLFWESAALERKEKILTECRAYYNTCRQRLPEMEDALSALSQMLSGTLDPEETEALLLLDQMDRGKRQLAADDSFLVALLTGYYEYCAGKQLDFRFKLTIPALFQKDRTDCLLLYDCLLSFACAWIKGASGTIKIREAEKFGIWHLQLSAAVTGTDENGIVSGDAADNAGRQLRRQLKWLLYGYHLKMRIRKTENQLEIDVIT